MSRNETKRQDYFLTYGEGYGPAGNRNMLEDGGNDCLVSEEKDF